MLFNPGPVGRLSRSAVPVSAGGRSFTPTTLVAFDSMQLPWNGGLFSPLDSGVFDGFLKCVPSVPALLSRLPPFSSSAPPLSLLLSPPPFPPFPPFFLRVPPNVKSSKKNPNAPPALHL